MAESRRKSGQAMVLAAAAIALLATMLALVINAGLFFAERRHLQNAADAAALAGAQRIAEEQTSRSFRDASVLSSIMALAGENAVDVGGNRQLQATYLDQNGSTLGSVGDPSQFTESAMGVEVQISGEFATIVPGFIGTGSLQVAAKARAGLVSLPFPSVLANPVALAVPLAAFQSGAGVDLYDQSVALASYGVGGYRPFLNLAHMDNTGSSYQAATDFGDLATDLQFWSDGLHNSGQLGIGNTIALASGDFPDQTRAGLLDAVRRQGLIDASGAPYALLDLPLWDTYQPGGVGGTNFVIIAGFARFKILQDEITTTTLRGYFVPYTVPSPSAGAPTGDRWGPSRLAILL
jgi:hypothetical protein